MTDRSADETLLAQFRLWLLEAHAEAETEGGPPYPEDEDGEVGFVRLIEEFTALRHELKLQTRSTRGLQDQAEAMLPALQQAIEQFRAVEPKEAQAAFAAGRPLAEALADLDEALDRGQRRDREGPPTLRRRPRPRDRGRARRPGRPPRAAVLAPATDRPQLPPAGPCPRPAAGLRASPRPLRRAARRLRTDPEPARAAP